MPSPETQSSIKMTRKRQCILNILEASSVPLSAYDIMDIYQQKEERRILAWSAYRMLKILTEAGLVIHLQSANKFMAAKGKTTNRPAHSVGLFMICKTCSQTHQVFLNKSPSEAISEQLDIAGFETSATSLEIPGVCKHCQDKKEENS